MDYLVLVTYINGIKSWQHYFTKDEAVKAANSCKENDIIRNVTIISYTNPETIL